MQVNDDILINSRYLINPRYLLNNNILINLRYFRNPRYLLKGGYFNKYLRRFVYKRRRGDLMSMGQWGGKTDPDAVRGVLTMGDMSSES